MKCLRKNITTSESPIQIIGYWEDLRMKDVIAYPGFVTYLVRKFYRECHDMH